MIPSIPKKRTTDFDDAYEGKRTKFDLTGEKKKDALNTGAVENDHRHDLFSKFYKKNFQIVNPILAKGLPLIIAVKSKPSKFGESPKLIFAKDILPTFDDKCKLDELNPEDGTASFAGSYLKDIEFFSVKDITKKPESIGRLADILGKNKSETEREFLLDIISVNRSDIMGSEIASAAVVFFSGLAVEQDKEYAKKLLRSIGTKEETSDALASSLVQTSYKQEDIGYAEAFLEMGADPDKPNFQGYTPASAALDGENFAAVDLLLKFGASVTEARGDFSAPIWETLNDPRIFPPSIKDEPIYETARKHLLREKKL